jgi:hypothetical protein
MSSPEPRPQDYATLNLVHSGLLAATALAARRRGSPEPLSAADMAQLSLAAFSIAKAVSREKIGTWVREPFVEQDAEHQPGPPRGRGLQHAIGELLTCTRCVGAWAALALVGLRLLSPRSGRIATTVLATSGANDFLQAAFKVGTEKANELGG